VLTQSFDDHVVYAFQFPSRVQLLAGHCITVWTAESRLDGSQTGIKRLLACDPHWNLEFLELLRWGVCPKYTTTLTRANGTVSAYPYPPPPAAPTGPTPCALHGCHAITR